MSKEIKDKIDKLNAQLEDMVVSGTFVLNRPVQDIYNVISKLQGECKHNFVNGICEFCYKEEANG